MTVEEISSLVDHAKRISQKIINLKDTLHAVEKFEQHTISVRIGQNYANLSAEVTASNLASILEAEIGYLEKDKKEILNTLGATE